MSFLEMNRYNHAYSRVHTLVNLTLLDLLPSKGQAVTTCTYWISIGYAHIAHTLFNYSDIVVAIILSGSISTEPYSTL